MTYWGYLVENMSGVFFEGAYIWRISSNYKTTQHDIKMDIVKYNKSAWDNYVDKKDRWTIPVSEQELENAKNGILF